MAEVIRSKEHEPGKQHDEDAEREQVLGHGIRAHWHAVGLRLDVEAGRVVLASHVQRPDVQRNEAAEHEGEQVVQAKEPVECGPTYRVATPEPGHHGRPEAWNDLID